MIAEQHKTMTPAAPEKTTTATLKSLQVDKSLSLYDAGSEGWQEAARNAAKTTVRTLHRTYIQLGGYLNEISKTHVDNDPMKPLVWQAWGYKNFAAYCEAELGMNERKMNFVSRIYRVVFEELASLPDDVRARVVDIDYSKIRELVGVLTADNVYEWLGEIEAGINCADLGKAVREYRQRAKDLGMYQDGKVVTSLPPVVQNAPKQPQKPATPSAPWPTPSPASASAPVKPPAAPAPTNVVQMPVKPAAPPPSLALSAKAAVQAVHQAKAGDVGTPMSPTLQETATDKFVAFLYPDQAKLVKMAFQAAQELSCSAKPGHLLTLICTDYLATNGAVVPGTEGFQNYLMNLEKIYGCDLIAIDRTSKKLAILAGKEHLLRIIKAMDDAIAVSDAEDDAADEHADDAKTAPQGSTAVETQTNLDLPEEDETPVAPAPVPAPKAPTTWSEKPTHTTAHPTALDVHVLDVLSALESDEEDDDAVGGDDPFKTDEEAEILRLASAADTPEEMDEILNSLALGGDDEVGDVEDVEAQGDELYDDE